MQNSKVRNCLCRNQKIPEEEKEIHHISEFRDHPQWLLTFTEMYRLFEKGCALAEIHCKMLLPSPPPSTGRFTNNWYRIGAQEVFVKRMNTCSVNFYLVSSYHKMRGIPLQVSRNVLCTLFPWAASGGKKKTNKKNDKTNKQKNNKGDQGISSLEDVSYYKSSLRINVNMHSKSCNLLTAECVLSTLLKSAFVSFHLSFYSNPIVHMLSTNELRCFEVDYPAPSFSSTVNARGGFKTWFMPGMSSFTFPLLLPAWFWKFWFA